MTLGAFIPTGTEHKNLTLGAFNTPVKGVVTVKTIVVTFLTNSSDIFPSVFALSDTFSVHEYFTIDTDIADITVANFTEVLTFVTTVGRGRVGEIRTDFVTLVVIKIEVGFTLVTSLRCGVTFVTIGNGTLSTLSVDFSVS
jgi:hypothetical protein